MSLTVVGIDLSSSEKRPTGFVVYDGRRWRGELVYSDDEIVEKTLAASPDVVAIDAPLSFPPNKRGLRECERALRAMGVHVYPPMMPSMAGLTERGVRLADVLRDSLAHGEVIETYPGGAQVVLGLPRKKEDLLGLMEGLVAMGVRLDAIAGESVRGKRDSGRRTGGVRNRPGVSHHIVDAATCALVGLFYAEKKVLLVGDPDEGVLVLPDPFALGTM